MLEQLLDLAKFVVKENIKHHKNNKLPVDYMNDVNSIYSEELNYYNTSEIYIVKDSLETILGSIRILKWNSIAIQEHQDQYESFLHLIFALQVNMLNQP